MLVNGELWRTTSKSVEVSVARTRPRPFIVEMATLGLLPEKKNSGS